MAQLPEGLVAVGGELSPRSVLAEYRRGVFPWYVEGQPVLWWCPDPRMVVFASERRIPRSLRRVIRSGRFRVTMDTAFAAVVAGCAEPRLDQDGTWITPQIFEAYAELARLGFAHSVETWEGDELVGGLYGVAIGRMFFGESMFARRSDASKVAFVSMLARLESWGMPLVDCQVPTSHLASLGGREIPRAEFLAQVGALIRQPPVPSPWRFYNED